MAAITTRTQKANRFSLLLLEDGEVLLSDLAVQYRFIPTTPIGSTLHPLASYPQRFVSRSANAALRGRVKIGTRNIFFDSDDWRNPVIRIPLISIDYARPTRDTSRSRFSDDGSTQEASQDRLTVTDDNSVLVFANNAVFQKELGTDHPYVDVKLPGKHIFTPLYTSGPQLLDEINALLHIHASSSRRKRDERLRYLVGQREASVPFDITLLEHGVKESALIDSAASAVYALSRAPGRFRITHENVYFMPIHGDSSQSVERIPTGRITSTRRLRHGCKDAALEIGFDEGEGKSIIKGSLMISFLSFQVREKAMSILLDVTGGDVNLFDRGELDTALNLWRRGQMSNFDYIMYLNMAAGRSFNDLSQYPVFPWVLKDYESDILDLSKESSFRDLTKPIGALQPDRLSILRERYEEMPPPKFFYGTHYSAPAYTINYLVRAAPAAMLRLQNGKFDTPDRLFHSLASTWHGVLHNQGDVKELIPEFYALDFSRGDTSGVVSKQSSPGDFLDNVLGLDLGVRQDGKRVDDVELPPWANGSSELFVKRNREALECDYVSSKLHSWIDLIFGIKSKTADACNIFYTDVALPPSIESSEEAKLSPEEIEQIETVYLEFGRTPQTLFAYPHPPRFGDIHFNERDQEHIASFGMNLNSVPVSPARAHATPYASPGMGSFEGDRAGSFLSPSPKISAPDNTRVPPMQLGSWGAQSRRRDSVLVGASEYILHAYEPQSSDRNESKHQAVPAPLVSKVVYRGDSALREAEIVDVCTIRNRIPNEHDEQAENESDLPVICTIWSDGYLKVHSATETLRSKHIKDACSIVALPQGLICYGTLSGSIGFYHIETGRSEVAVDAAHDAEVCALEHISECQTLISASKDGSIKIWLVGRAGHRVSLQIFQELDAENSINDISGSADVVVSANDASSYERQLLVAVATTDGQLMSWEISLDGEGDEILEPTWRVEYSLPPGTSELGESWRRMRKITWLFQGDKRRPAIASVHEHENCIRIWSLNETKMAVAEVFVTSGGARCITQCESARTVLVGGNNGEIREFDSTGLCLGTITTGPKEVRNILLPKAMRCFFVFAGANDVCRVNI